MNKQITNAQNMQLLGLLTLAAKYNALLDDIVKSAIEITGEDDVGGHTGDAVYGSRTHDDLLKVLNIEVVG